MLMPQGLLDMVDEEINRGKKKWGDVDKTPGDLLNAATEELGEVAHACNHNEGPAKVQQEIAETIGVLARLYQMMQRPLQSSIPASA